MRSGLDKKSVGLRMLTQQHLRKHHAFLHRLYTTRTVKALRQEIAKAQHHQLRTLLLTLAAVALKKLPAPESVRRAFFRSHKKKLLREILGSRAKFRKFLAEGTAGEWRQALSSLAPLLHPTLSVVFQP